MKLGYNTWSMPMLSYEDSVALLAGLGYDSLELTVCEGWPTDAMLAPPGVGATWRRMADDVGLDVTSVTANAPVLVDEPDWPAVFQRLQRAFDLAAEIQKPGQRMPVSLGALPPATATHRMPTDGDRLWDEYQTLIIDRFGLLAAEAAERGVRVALECHVGAVVSRPQRALAVLAGIESDHLGVNLDISHFDVQGMDIGGVVNQLGPYAIACEVKDERGVEPDFEFLIPGEGDFDYAGFIKAMDDVGYSGSISVEISLFRQRQQPYDAADAAAQSYRVLSAAFDQAGVVRTARNGRDRVTR